MKFRLRLAALSKSQEYYTITDAIQEPQRAWAQNQRKHNRDILDIIRYNIDIL